MPPKWGKILTPPIPPLQTPPPRPRRGGWCLELNYRAPMQVLVSQFQRPPNKLFRRCAKNGVQDLPQKISIPEVLCHMTQAL